MRGLAVVIVTAGCGRIGFDTFDAWQPEVAPITASGGVDWIRQITATRDGFLVAGSFSVGFAIGGETLPNAGAQDGFVVALDRAGALRWVRTCSSSNEDQALTVDADADGNVYVGGTTGAGIDCGGGPLTAGTSFMAWLASFTATGDYRWSRGLPSADALPGMPIDAVRRLATAPGRVVTSGYVHGNLDFGGGNSAPLGPTYDGFVAAYTGDDGFVWARRFGGGETIGRGVTVDEVGAWYITGSMTGTADFGGGPLTAAGSQAAYVAAYDAAGGHRWSRLLGDSGAAEGRAIVVVADVVHVVGHFDTQVTNGNSVTSAGADDVFVATFTTAGTPQRVLQLGGPGCDRANDVVGLGTEIGIAGRFADSVTFGSTVITSAGGSDAFFATLALDGTPGPIWRRGGALDDNGVAIAPTPDGLLVGATLDRPVQSACDDGVIFDTRATVLEAISR